MGQVYLDEGVSAITDAGLDHLGDDVVDARSVVRHSTSDHHHLAVATLLNRVLVAHNRTDFDLLHNAWRDWFDRFGQPPVAMHAGILIIPQPPVLPPDLAAELSHSFLNDPATEPLVNRCFEWSDERGWDEIVPSPPWPPEANTARRAGMATPSEIADYLRRTPEQDAP